jgi:hypothetical protein
LKQALLIDFACDGVLETFASLALGEDRYETQLVQSSDQAEAYMADGLFHLVLVRQQGGSGGVWRLVELASEMSLGRSLVIVSSEEADEALHAQAREAGAVVLSAPADARTRAGASLLSADPVADAR